MNKSLHVIYVPGLGDTGEPKSQKWAVAWWNNFGVEPELFQMKWGDKEPWAPKFERLLKRIDEIAATGQLVGLVGASAGASAVINAYAARKNVIAGVVCIAGKVNRPEVIHPIHLQKNPAFVTSVKNCQSAILKLNESDRGHILSRYGFFDEIVKRADSEIPGGQNHFSPTIGHVLTIAIQITLGSRSFIRFLKRQTGSVEH